MCAASGSRLGPVDPPRQRLGLDAGVVGAIAGEHGKRCCGCGRVARFRADVGGAGRFGCRSSIRPASLGGMVVCDRDRTGSITQAATPSADGGQTDPDLASGHVLRAWPRRRLGRCEGADVSVAQAVVDEGEQLAGHRDGGAARLIGDVADISRRCPTSARPTCGPWSRRLRHPVRHRRPGRHRRRRAPRAPTRAAGPCWRHPGRGRR